MSDIARDGAMADEDRLPWLEVVDDDDVEGGVTVGKLVALIIAALVALGIVIGGIWMLRSQSAPPPVDPKLIAAQAGDYKVKPENPGGMKVEGKGDSAFAASEGVEANGKIDTNAMPESPLKGIRGPVVADVASKPSTNATVAVPKATTTLTAKPPMPVAQKTVVGTGVVQLGAYGSQAKADTAWSMLSKKYDFLASLTKSVVPAEVGGSKVYRLRVNAAGEAAAVCAKLKAADENCLIAG